MNSSGISITPFESTETSKEEPRPIRSGFFLFLEGKFGLLCSVLLVIMLNPLVLPAQDKPDWLKERPVNRMYYIGIGGATIMDGETDYNARARDNALNDLVSQIEVDVSSETVSTLKEQDGVTSELFESAVQARAKADIENYEVVDSWNSGEEYWVYIRLSRIQYQTRLEEKIAQAQQRAYKAFQDGRKASAGQDIATALTLYVQGIGDVAPYLDKLPGYPVSDGQKIDLYAELRSAAQSALNAISMTGAKGPKTGRVGTALDRPFSVKIVTADGNKPVNGIPVAFDFVKGGGKMKSPVVSGADGVATARVSLVTEMDKLQILNTTIDLEAMLGEGRRNPLTLGLLQGFNSPSNRFVVKIAGLPVYMDYSEDFLGEVKTTQYLEPVLKKNLTEVGYTFVEDPAEAELYMEVKSTVKEGSETYGLYSAFLDYSISITSLKTGEEVASYSQTDLKGISDNYEKAAAKAYAVGIDSLESAIIQKMVEQIRK